MFNLFDKDNDGFLNKKEFKGGIDRLFAENFEDNLRLVYDLFDFDSDEKVSKEDMRILLSHVPLAHLLELSDSRTPKNAHKLSQKSGT